MRQRVIIFLLVFLTTMETAWGADPATKLSRGLVNTLWGWFEIVNEMGNEADRKGPWMGIPAGLVRGSFFGVGRTLAGGYEVVTFLLPNGKKGYEPIVMPESVFARR